MASALLLYESKRIHSACSVIYKGKKLSDLEIAEIYPDGLYNGMPIVHELPPGVKTGEKEISDYLYISEKYVYDPLPKPSIFPVAPRNIVEGEYITVDGVMYKVTANIPNGAPIITGQNAIATTIEAQLFELTKGE